MKRVPWLLAMIGCFLLALGCAKRVPVADLTYDEHQRVVLTFRTGEQIEGRIAPGQNVVLREPRVVSEGKVKEVDDQKIVLTGLVPIRDADGVEKQVSRLENARVSLEPPAPDKMLLKSDITNVDQVRFDIARTARSASFWTTGAVIVTLLLGERS